MVTEKVAIALYPLSGRGMAIEADRVAVAALRDGLNALPINGEVVIGEGERDQAPMLSCGEKVGNGLGIDIDIAVDPLEGTTVLANAGYDSLSVIAMAHKGCLLKAPDLYMDKIAIGFDYHEQIIDLDNSPAENLRNVAKVKKCEVSDLTVIILDRSRHDQLIGYVREAGARVRLIQDGDISAVIATTGLAHRSADMYMGIGGAPEGVLAAAALSTTGGQICSRLIVSDDNSKRNLQKAGIFDSSKKYLLPDLVQGEVLFVATGVTEGNLLQGVKFDGGNYITNSLIMHNKTSTIRKTQTIYKNK